MSKLKHKRRNKSHQSTARPVQAAAIEAEPTASPIRDRILLVLFWSYVLIPLAWGVKSTVEKALLLFR
ncbi:MFS transporter small subunit [Methylomagnum sp.]